MKKILVALLFLAFASRGWALETISPEELKPGMKGYGLSVFSGYKIEKFEVEVIDIVKQALPGSDMILVKCSGANLEKSKLIAGMSGSPVYFDGKLAGAVAYTWSFQNEPVGGLTPIATMMAASAQQGSKAVVQNNANKDSPLDSSLKPVGCPVMISGLSGDLFPEVKKILEPFGVGPISAGGGRVEDPEAPARIEPGSALGVELISGDLNATAVGTATLVQGNTVYAFGHGLMNGGPVSLPLVLAKVNTVISSSNLSFKMASPVRRVGTLQRDFPVAISGKLGEKPRTIPITIEVKNDATGGAKTFHFEIADHPMLSLNLMQICLLQALSLTGAISENATAVLDMDMALEGYSEKISYHDSLALNRGSFSPAYVLPAMLFANNPFQKVKISEVAFKIRIRPGWEVAEIKSVWANKLEVVPGDTVTIGVRLKRYQGQELEQTVNFEIPKDAQGIVNVAFVGGENMALDFAPPDSIDDLIAAFKKLPSPTWLVMQYQKPGVILDYQGERLKDLPPSAQSLFAGPANTQAKRVPDYDYKTFDTPYIIKGAAAIQFHIKPDSGRTKK